MFSFLTVMKSCASAIPVARACEITSNVQTALHSLSFIKLDQLTVHILFRRKTCFIPSAKI